MAGRRLRDGAAVGDGRLARGISGTALGVATLVAALATVPTHASFEQHLLLSLAEHPDGDKDAGSAGLLGSLGALLERTRIGVRADSRHCLLLRYGTFDGRPFVGAFGTWAPLPWTADAWDRLTARGGAWEGAGALGGGALRRCAHALRVCSRGGAAPHEALVAVLVGVYLAWLLFPRFTLRHCLCSPRAIADGRVHTLVTSNLLHLRFAHLAHNALMILHYAPLLLDELGCDRLLALLLLACIGSSGASLLWARRGGGASIGASGLAMALLAANAALRPHAATHVYGLELPAPHAALAYLCLDVAMRSAEGVDASAHVGGALCGWALARSWAPAGVIGWLARRGAW